MSNRLAGHKLETEWNGEFGRESSNTGRCTCGWSESCNSKAEVQREYSRHLDRARAAIAYNKDQSASS